MLAAAANGTRGPPMAPAQGAARAHARLPRALCRGQTLRHAPRFPTEYEQSAPKLIITQNVTHHRTVDDFKMSRSTCQNGTVVIHSSVPTSNAANAKCSFVTPCYVDAWRFQEKKNAPWPSTLSERRARENLRAKVTPTTLGLTEVTASCTKRFHWMRG